MMSRIVNDPELSKSILGQRDRRDRKSLVRGRGCAVLRLADEQARMRPRESLYCGPQAPFEPAEALLFRLLDRM